MLAIDARLLLDELLEDATQVLNLQQSLLVLDIASNRKRVRINHQLVQLLLQVDLVSIKPQSNSKAEIVLSLYFMINFA